MVPGRAFAGLGRPVESAGQSVSASASTRSTSDLYSNGGERRSDPLATKNSSCSRKVRDAVVERRRCSYGLCYEASLRLLRTGYSRLAASCATEFSYW